MLNDHLLLKYADWECSAALNELLNARWNGIIEFIDRSELMTDPAVKVPLLITEAGKYEGYDAIRVYARSLIRNRFDNESFEDFERLCEAEREEINKARLK